MPVSTDATQQWSNYWRQGHLTSLPSGFSSNYDGEFLQFWNSQFALLKPGSRMLDVCSGNGSVALLARDYADRHKLDLEIKAVDAADIDIETLKTNKPGLARQIEAIEFLPNTPIEDLSAEAASADLVTSQFGIEYTDWDASAQTVARTLTPGGYFALICHALESTIMTRMEKQHRDYARLFDISLFDQEIQADDRNHPAFREQFIRQLGAALDTLYGMFQQDRTSDVFAAIGPELEKIGKETLKDFHSGLRWFIHFTSGLKISYSTSADLLSVNRRLQQSPDWIEVFVDSGLQLTGTEAIHYRTGEHAGQAYQFRKPDHRV